MKRGTLILLVLALLLLLGMVFTLWLGRESRHGYGLLVDLRPTPAP